MVALFDTIFSYFSSSSRSSLFQPRKMKRQVCRQYSSIGIKSACGVEQLVLGGDVFCFAAFGFRI
jgi:hypothetical protein